MDAFWKAAAESHRMEQEAAKQAEREKEKEEAAAAAAAAAAAKREVTPAPTVVPAEPPAAPKKKKGATRIRRRRTVSSSSDSSIDDRDVVTVGKHVARIRDINRAYPLLARRHQAAIHRGVRKLADGDFDEQLTSKEKKSIAQKRKKYKKVAKKGRNPFEDKYRKVGDTYRKFMSEVSFKRVDSSSSSSDSSSEMSD
jgi:hypothetical protein